MANYIYFKGILGDYEQNQNYISFSNLPPFVLPRQFKGDGYYAVSEMLIKYDSANIFEPRSSELLDLSEAKRLKDQGKSVYLQIDGAEILYIHDLINDLTNSNHYELTPMVLNKSAVKMEESKTAIKVPRIYISILHNEMGISIKYLENVSEEEMLLFLELEK